MGPRSHAWFLILELRLAGRMRSGKPLDSICLGVLINIIKIVFMSKDGLKDWGNAYVSLQLCTAMCQQNGFKQVWDLLFAQNGLGGTERQQTRCLAFSCLANLNPQFHGHKIATIPPGIASVLKAYRKKRGKTKRHGPAESVTTSQETMDSWQSLPLAFTFHLPGLGHAATVAGKEPGELNFYGYMHYRPKSNWNFLYRKNKGKDNV